MRLLALQLVAALVATTQRGVVYLRAREWILRTKRDPHPGLTALQRVILAGREQRVQPGKGLK